MTSISNAEIQPSRDAASSRAFRRRHAAGTGRRLPRVLLAEDDGETRSVLAGVLRKDHHEVIEARDGAEMISMLGSELLCSIRGSRVALIISDLRMPGATGLSVLAGIRHSDWSTPFILVTAFGGPAVLDAALRKGATAVLSKPLELQEFRTTVLDLTFPCALPGAHRPRCFVCGGFHHTRPDERTPGQHVCLTCAGADLKLAAVDLDSCVGCGHWHQVHRDGRRLGCYSCLECDRASGDIADLYRDDGGQG